MHISNKAISLLAAVGLIAAQLLTPVAAYAETDSAVADQVEAAATDDNFGSENPYLSEFSGSSFRYENGKLRRISSQSPPSAFPSGLIMRQVGASMSATLRVRSIGPR